MSKTGGARAIRFGTPEKLCEVLDCQPGDFGLDGEAMSRRLLDHGVCATAMTGWGETHAAQYIRFVFANEPTQRLELLGARVRKALSI